MNQLLATAVRGDPADNVTGDVADAVIAAPVIVGTGHARLRGRNGAATQAGHRLRLAGRAGLRGLPRRDRRQHDRHLGRAAARSAQRRVAGGGVRVGAPRACRRERSRSPVPAQPAPVRPRPHRTGQAPPRSPPRRSAAAPQAAPKVAPKIAPKTAVTTAPKVADVVVEGPHGRRARHRPDVLVRAYRRHIAMTLRLVGHRRHRRHRPPPSPSTPEVAVDRPGRRHVLQRAAAERAGALADRDRRTGSGPGRRRLRGARLGELGRPGDRPDQRADGRASPCRRARWR